MRRALTVVLAVVMLGLCIAAFAGDIVTMPTANQLKKGQLDVAYYYLSFDLPPGAPESLQAQTIYLGITDEIELDVHRYDPDGDRESIILNASYSLMRETLTKPDVVIGGRNLLGKKTTDNPLWDSNDKSFFISAAKTLGLPPAGPPKPPFVRIHASLGTADPSLLGQDRHKGLFGGIQALLTPEIGAIVLHDGQDLITGLTYTPKTMPLTIKGGGFGDHWWVGLSYAK